jgi:hypothetical protein
MSADSKIEFGDTERPCWHRHPHFSPWGNQIERVARVPVESESMFLANSFVNPFGPVPGARFFLAMIACNPRLEAYSVHLRIGLGIH